MRKKKWNEIRLDEDTQEDDIVISCDSIHLERMNKGFWSLLVWKGNKFTKFYIINRQEGLMVELVENQLKTKVIKHPNDKWEDLGHGVRRKPLETKK